MPFILIYDIVQLSTLVKLRTDVVYLTLVSWANWISFSEKSPSGPTAIARKAIKNVVISVRHLHRSAHEKTRRVAG